MPEAERSLLEQLNAIRQDLQRLQARPVFTELKTGDYRAREEEFVRCAPGTGGMTLLLPTPTIENRGARITALVERVSLASLVIQCTGGLVNDAASQTVALVCRIDLVSDGVAGWRSEIGPHSVPLSALPQAGAYSFLGNMTGATADVTANATSALRGIGLTVTSAGKLELRQRPRLAELRDYFASGTAATGSIGSLGWNLFGTLATYARSSITSTTFGSSNRGVLTTGVVANDRAVLALGETEARDVATVSGLRLLQCVWNHDNVLTNKRVFFGLMGTMATEPSAAVDCLGIYYDSAVSANYQIIARASSAGSPTVSSTAVPANTGELMTIYQSTAGTIDFYSGNTLLGSISSGLPTADMNVGVRLETLVIAAAKTLNVGYFGLSADAGGAFDDDAFLEA